MYNKLLTIIILSIIITMNSNISLAKIYNNKKIYALIIADGISALSLKPEIRDGIQFPYYIGYLVMGQDNYPFEFVGVDENVFTYRAELLSNFVTNKYFLFDMNLPKEFQYIEWDSEHFDEFFWFWLSNHGIWTIPIPSGLDSSKFEPSFSYLCIYNETINPPEHCRIREWEIRDIFIPYDRP